MKRVRVVPLLERFGIPVPASFHEEVWAPCPAHRDAHPSWSINATTGAHHCFSCGWGGGAATLVLLMLGAEQLGWTTTDAWRWIEEHGFVDDPAVAGVQMVLAAGRPPTFRMPACVRIGVAAREWPSPARRYLQERGIPYWQVQRWRIGFAVDGRLEGRIVFPIRDGAGRDCGYSARTFVGHAKRYLTPDGSENPVGSVVFGEEHWPRERAHIIVTEGAIDALAAERAFSCSVAALSGATRARDPLVLGKLATFGAVTVLTDADAAGDAAWETLRAALARHTDARRVRLPPGEDAASLPTEALQEAVACHIG